MNVEDHNQALPLALDGSPMTWRMLRGFYVITNPNNWVTLLF